MIFFFLLWSVVSNGWIIDVAVDNALPFTVGHEQAVGVEYLNHEIFGGLYTQLIFGESFEEAASDGLLATWNTSNTAPYRESLYGFHGCRGRFDDEENLHDVSKMWHGEKDAGAMGSYELLEGGSMNGFQYQRVTNSHTSGRVGISNYGVNCQAGIYFVRHDKYDGYFYAKTQTASVTVEACLEVWDTSNMKWNISGCTSVTVSGSGWTKYEMTIYTGLPASCGLFPTKHNPELWQCNGRFSFWLLNSGTVDFDYTFLQMPVSYRVAENLPARKDVTDMLTKERIGLVRMGGSMCNVDGYRWKKFRGYPRESRQPYHGMWYQYYGGVVQSRAFSMFELIDTFNHVGIEPIVTFNNYEWPSDMADFVEYCWGNETTKWGKKRIEDDKHPSPYKVSWIEIGNEQPMDWVLINAVVSITKAMDTRSTAIGAPMFRYCIGHNAFWEEMVPGGEQYNPATLAMFQATTFLEDRIWWDYHLDTGASALAGQDFQQDIDAFKAMRDSVSSQMRIAVLEENGGDHGIWRAVGHAVYSNVMIQNADIVPIHGGYANGLEFWQGMNLIHIWDQGQLFISPDKTWGGPVWYVIDMIGRTIQPTVVKTTVWQQPKDKLPTLRDVPTPITPPQYTPSVTSTISADKKTVVVRVANADSANNMTATIELLGVASPPTTVQMEVIKDWLHPNAPVGVIDNLPNDEQRVAPKQSTENYSPSKQWIFTPISFTIFTFTLP